MNIGLEGTNILVVHRNFALSVNRYSKLTEELRNFP
jgi:hypothetical protein